MKTKGPNINRIKNVASDSAGAINPLRELVALSGAEKQLRSLIFAVKSNKGRMIDEAYMDMVVNRAEKFAISNKIPLVKIH